MGMALAMTLGMAACGSTGGSSAASTGSSAASTSTAAAAGDQKVTVIIKNTTAPFFISMKEGAEAAGKELGINVEVKAPTETDESAGNSQQTQLAEEAIANKTSCLVMCPVDKEGIMPAIEKVTEAGIPVVELNSRLADESKAETFVGLENVKQGYGAMEQLLKGLDGEGKILIIEGSTGAQTSIDRIEGAKQAIEDANANGGKFEILASQSANYNRAEALNVVQNLLQSYPDANAIFCCNDEMALGSVEAVNAAGKTGSILISGADANDDACAAIKEGTMYCTSYGNPYMQGYEGVQAAYDVLNGGAKTDFYEVDTVVVTSENVDTFKDQK